LKPNKSKYIMYKYHLKEPFWQSKLNFTKVFP
jgi:hypothetical protein